MLKYIVVFAGASLLAISLPAKAQEQRDIVALSSEEIMTPSDTVPRKKTVIVDGVELNEKQLKRYYRQLRRHYFPTFFPACRFEPVYKWDHCCSWRWNVFLQ